MRYPRWVVLSDGSCPTEDIYFLGSAAPWLQARGVEVRRIDTSYWRLPIMCMPWLVGEMRHAHVLVCRSLNAYWLSWLEANRERLATIRYLVDDDIPAAAEDPRLPASYRRRMRHVATQLQPRLFALADEVIASSAALGQQLRRHHPAVAVLTPPLIGEPLATTPPPALTRIGFYGSRAHLGDLEAITPALVALHQCHTELSFEIMLGEHTPRALQGLARVQTPRALNWRAFQRYRGQHSADIGLTPMVDTPFNAGKSHIKFLDNALMGSVGIYSRCSPYRDVVEDGVDGLLVDNAEADWRGAVERLVQQPGEARAMARRAAYKARELGDPARARAFWWARR
ncbi:hypothetical protein GY26_05990 [Gammaproteobacteria bacterium MFB021]|nr:hypothetical protein GY26_05990 [Gammaproteobacteria bacterium MFB021]